MLVVVEGKTQWQAEGGQYLLAFEGDPSKGSLNVIERERAKPSKGSADEWLEHGMALERDNVEAALHAAVNATVRDVVPARSPGGR